MKKAILLSALFFFAAFNTAWSQSNKKVEKSPKDKTEKRMHAEEKSDGAAFSGKGKNAQQGTVAKSPKGKGHEKHGKKHHGKKHAKKQGKNTEAGKAPEAPRTPKTPKAPESKPQSKESGKKIGQPEGRKSPTTNSENTPVKQDKSVQKTKNTAPSGSGSN
jgi:hypothetical protein